MATSSQRLANVRHAAGELTCDSFGALTLRLVDGIGAPLSCTLGTTRISAAMRLTTVFGTPFHSLL